MCPWSATVPCDPLRICPEAVVFSWWLRAVGTLRQAYSHKPLMALRWLGTATLDRRFLSPSVHLVWVCIVVWELSQTSKAPSALPHTGVAPQSPRCLTAPGNLPLRGPGPMCTLWTKGTTSHSCSCAQGRMMCFPRNTSLGRYLKMPSRVYAWCQEILYIPDEVTISLRLKFRYAESL